MLLLKILRKIGILKKIVLTRTRKINNSLCKIPIIRGIGMGNLQESEPWMNKVIKKAISINDDHSSFVDIGVNIGQTLLKVKTISPNLNYIGIEPNQEALAYVNSLVNCNGFEKIKILPVAIGQKTAVIDLFLNPESSVDSGATIIKDYRKGQTMKRSIIVVNASDIKDEFEKKVGVIKIDVEGAEYQVLSSFHFVLERDRPIIIIEILPVYSKENTHRLENQKALLETIQRLNYKIFRINKSAENKFEKFIELKDIGIISDLILCDYVFAPAEKVELLKLS